MKTIRLVLRKEKTNKSGLAPIAVRMTQDRKSHYVSTGISIPISEWDEVNQSIKVGSDFYHLQPDIDKKKQEIYMSCSIDCEQPSIRKVKTIIPTIADCFEKEMRFLEEKGKIGTLTKYRYCLLLLKHCSLHTVRINNIDRDYLEAFDMYLIQRDNNSNSRATKFSVLRAVYNKARQDGIVLPTIDPFVSFHSGRLWKQTRKRAIKKEDILKIQALEINLISSPYSLSFARDIFMFSYLTGGINFGDIAQLRQTNIIDGRLYYTRHKTGKELNFKLTPETERIIESYRTTDPEDYLFPILSTHRHRTEQQVFNRIHKVLRIVNTNLKEIAKLASIEGVMTTYVARHSFATILKRSGVQISVISEAMGHRDITTTEIYLDSFENDQRDAAMSNLL